MVETSDAIPSPLDPAITQAVREAFEARQVPYLKRLVDTPSHTHARDDVEAAAKVLDEMVEALGLQTERVPDPSGRFADHRIYRTKACDEHDRSLALVGHVDTVFPRSMNFLEFQRDAEDSESKGDVIRGPGTLDMKSGLSCILFALDAVKRAAPSTFAKLKARFICVSDEEVGSPSSKALYDDICSRLTFALVFEAGRDEDRLVTQRKGAGVWTFTAKGRAAHAGLRHSEGINAIHALSLVIPRIEAVTDEERGVTCNVGLIEGGTAKNTVPDTATCTVDVRFIRAEDVAYVEEEFGKIQSAPFAGVDVNPPRVGEATIEVTGGVSRGPMEATPAITLVREEMERFSGATGLGVGEAPLQGGGSDANLLAANGVPVIDGLGPFGKHFHKVEEWSSLTSLRRRTEALASFLVHGAPRLESALEREAAR